jgi:hypothetical protein
MKTDSRSLKNEKASSRIVYRFGNLSENIREFLKSAINQENQRKIVQKSSLLSLFVVAFDVMYVSKSPIKCRINTFARWRVFWIAHTNFEYGVVIHNTFMVYYAKAFTQQYPKRVKR